ncbi:hypothetical protein [Brucella intermedia]|uniref:hypothetical protein n=1 Tax=Brucella intermedia TaxID=94625 RepID=UPI0023618DE6|nr:hypothetical protein [Brucella intermedia]
MPKERFFGGSLRDVRVEAMGSPASIFLVIEAAQAESPPCWFPLSNDQARALRHQIDIQLSALDSGDE